MGRSLRIAVADDEIDMQEYFRITLPRLGHIVVAVAGSGQELVEKCRQQRPDLVLTDIKMPDMDGLEAVAQISTDTLIPVILVSAHFDLELLARAEQQHVLAYLIKPIKQADLEPAITVAMRRSDQFRALSQEAADLKQALEDRKLIERAKGIVMKTMHLDEAEAFRRLQKMASDHNRKLVEVARMLLAAKSPFP